MYTLDPWKPTFGIKYLSELYMGVEPKIGGGCKTPQIIDLFIGFSMKFSPSILGGFPPIFGNIHIDVYNIPQTQFR